MRDRHPIRLHQRCWAMLSTVLLGGWSASSAAASTVQASTTSELSNGLMRSDVDIVEMQAHLDGRGRIEIAIDGDKTLRAGNKRLPLLVLRGSGSLTIEGGLYTETALDEATSLPDPGARVRSFVRLQDDVDLRLVDTSLDVPQPQTTGTLPLAVVEIQEEQISVSMHGIQNSPELPLTFALAITTNSDPISSTFELNRSTLYVGDGAILHGLRWDSPRQAVANSLVALYDSWFEMVDPDATSTAVGMPADGDPTAPYGMPFVESTDHLVVVNTRFSGLRTNASTLLRGRRIQIDQGMVDTLYDIDPSIPSPASVAIAGNIFVQSSMMCDIDGSDALFASVPDDDPSSTTEDPLSVYVLNSVFWQLNHSLFHLDLAEGDWDTTPWGRDSGLFAANITLHLRDLTTANASTPVATATEAHPRLVLQNAYLQGHWNPGDPSSRRVFDHVIVSEPVHGDPCLPQGDSRCVHTAALHLSEAVLTPTCTEVMDNFTTPMLLEGTDRRQLGNSLLDLSPDDLPVRDRRPALQPFTELDGNGSNWSAPTSFGTWGDRIECTADTPTPIVGAWSGNNDASSGHTCSLAVLEPDEPIETEAPTGNPPANNDLYGLSSDCRYSAAGVWILLPIVGCRRRKKPGDCRS
ncbi:MAG: hypothetical protein CL927_16925 [Deltaproteobacteria bacterium]|nr:hypothetical protein [Deltaproteobacteria bacterium]